MCQLVVCIFLSFYDKVSCRCRGVSIYYHLSLPSITLLIIKKATTAPTNIPIIPIANIPNPYPIVINKKG